MRRREANSKENAKSIQNEGSVHRAYRDNPLHCPANSLQGRIVHADPPKTNLLLVLTAHAANPSPCRVRSGKPQPLPCEVRPGQVRSGQARPGQVRSGQVQVRSGQVRSGSG